MKTFKAWLVIREEEQSSWTAEDEEAAREGELLHRGRRRMTRHREILGAAGGPQTLSQKVFSTHRGVGTKAVAPPSGSKLHRREN